MDFDSCEDALSKVDLSKQMTKLVKEKKKVESSVFQTFPGRHSEPRLRALNAR